MYHNNIAGVIGSSYVAHETCTSASFLTLCPVNSAPVTCQTVCPMNSAPGTCQTDRPVNSAPVTC